MKKIILTAGLLAIIATASFAGNEKTLAAMTPEQRVDNSIKSQISVPRALTEVPGEYTAEVHFHVNADGSLAINDVITDSEDLKYGLMRQAKDISVSTEGLDLTSGYKLTVRFNVIGQD